ncbi:hypothetical protein PQQ87_34275 [Paraburkholderia nemoris]|uniref:hypothetical protein n=1 Tax=Paraburkholderia nemoris TaxID=2793076 RepID=UPI0038BB6519
MSPKLDTTLCEKYPKIFAHRHIDSTIIGGRGFECGDGWYDLIDLLCHNLQGETDHNGGPQAVADQVKEKFAGLRFYAHGVNDRMLGMITMAETFSHAICDVCGNRGKTVERKGVHLTRCVNHEYV